MAKPAPARCPHCHLPVSFLKKLGGVVKKVGSAAAKAAIEAALSNLGAFQK